MLDAYNHVGLAVSDLDTSIRFYRDILGFELKEKFETGPGRERGRPEDTTLHHRQVAMLRFNELWIELVHTIPPVGRVENLYKNNIGAAHLAFYCADIEKTYRELVAQGVKFYAPPSTSTVGRRLALFTDPDGFAIELNEAIEGRR